VARSFALWPLLAAECGDKLVPVTHPLEPWIAVESVDPNDPIAAPSDTRSRCQWSSIASVSVLFLAA